MRIIQAEGNPDKQRLEIEDIFDAEVADTALHDYHHNVKGYRSYLADSKVFPMMLGFGQSQKVIEGLSMRFLTVEEVQERKLAAGQHLSAVAVAHENGPDAAAVEAIPDDALIAVTDIRTKQGRTGDPAPDLTAA